MQRLTHLSEKDEEKLRKILRGLTPQQLRFVAARPHCNSDAEAAREAGIPPSTVWRWPQKVHVAVRLMAGDGMIASYEMLRSALPKAAMRKIDGLDSGDEKVRQAAATEILDRFHGRPKQSIDTNVTATVAAKAYVGISPDDWDDDNSAIQTASVASNAVEGQESDHSTDG